MNGLVDLSGTCAIDCGLETIEREYASAFSWSEGRRLPGESKMVHLACSRALLSAGLGSSRNLGNRAGLVLAGIYGGLASYERFLASLSRTRDMEPTAFSFSLPGIPASVLSIYYGITGPVLSLSTTVDDTAARLVDSARGLLDSGLCDYVIAGNYYYPSRAATSAIGLSRGQAAIAVFSRTTATEGNSKVELGAKPVRDFLSPKMHNARETDSAVWRTLEMSQ